MLSAPLSAPSPYTTLTPVPRPEDYPEVRLPAPHPVVCERPLGLAKLSAGFPSPASAYDDKRLDINDYLIRNPVSTFFFSVTGDSMEVAEIFNGDVLVVDRSIEAQHGHIVVAFYHGDRLVKRLHNRGGRLALLAENPAYPPLEIENGDELVVWGVVTGKFKRFL